MQSRSRHIVGEYGVGDRCHTAGDHYAIGSVTRSQDARQLSPTRSDVDPDSVVGELRVCDVKSGVSRRRIEEDCRRVESGNANGVDMEGLSVLKANAFQPSDAKNRQVPDAH